MSAEVIRTPATMPSTTATSARPCDSPAVVHRNTRPIFARRGRSPISARFSVLSALLQVLKVGAGFSGAARHRFKGARIKGCDGGLDRRDPGEVQAPGLVAPRHGRRAWGATSDHAMTVRR